MIAGFDENASKLEEITKLISVQQSIPYCPDTVALKRRFISFTTATERRGGIKYPKRLYLYNDILILTHGPMKLYSFKALFKLRKIEVISVLGTTVKLELDKQKEFTFANTDNDENFIEELIENINRSKR